MDTNRALPATTQQPPPSVQGAAVVPRNKQDELIEKFSPYVEQAIAVIYSIMMDETCTKRTRLEAADMIVSRVYGKPTVKHDVQHTASLQDALQIIAQKAQRYEAVVTDVTEVKELPDTSGWAV